MSEHQLADGTLTREVGGIIARCKCGWVSAGHFSSAAASVAMMDHQEREARSKSLGSEKPYNPPNFDPTRIMG